MRRPIYRRINKSELYEQKTINLPFPVFVSAVVANIPGHISRIARGRYSRPGIRYLHLQ
jgi:hypothetical protein